MKQKTCCFTGHRDIPLGDYQLIFDKTEEIVERLIKKGYLYFGAGGALGFDTIAALAVLKLKEHYPDIRLILVLPCRFQTRGWASEDVKIYENIKEQADKFVYTSEEYTRGCMHKRNRHLVDNSSACIAYLTESKGETAYTVDYAAKHGLTVRLLVICKGRNTMKKKLIISLIAVILVLGVAFAIGALVKENKDTLQDMIIRIESAIKEVLGDDVKKQTETIVVGTLKYADKESNEINYHILKTTYYEADPSEITGLNVDALGVLINPDSANRCKEMKIKNWDAALYEFDEHSYLCWTDTPEISYVLEYGSEAVPDEEIVKMAESAETLERNK